MNPLTALARSITKPLQRSMVPLSMADWNDMFSLDGMPLLHTTMTPNQEGDVGSDLQSLVGGAYARNGVIFACMLARLSIFSEARFLWQQMRNGIPANLFSTAELGILDEPEPGKSLGDLLIRASVDLDLAGNWYGARRGNRIKRLRPDWVTIMVGSPTRDMSAWDPDAQVVGYVYTPGGPGGGEEPITFAADEVAHWSMVPDPLFQYRGMSWLLPILREMMGDSAATAHKQAFFRNAATPNLSISLPESMTLEKARSWIELFEQEHRGVANAYRTVYFGGGATPTPVGLNFQQMDFRNLQSGYETRIASVAGMHPVIVPFSEGLTGSSLNAGNFEKAARLVADKTLRPMWRNFAASLERVLVKPNPATRLWYDERDIAFLRTDVKDEAEIEQRRASTINTYITAGFKPESVISAISSGYDLSQLQHTGLFSVQLQAPQANTPQLETPQVPAGRGLTPVNCSNCGRVIGEADGAVRLRCKRCGTYTQTRVGGESNDEMRTALITFLTREQKAPEVRVEAPITMHPPALTISEGALRVDSPITVHPSPVNINEGAVRVEAAPAPNVTVHPPDIQVPVTISEGAVHVQTPDVQVPVNVDINEGAVQVTMPEQAPNTVTIEQGAVQSSVSLPEALELKSDVLQEELVERLEKALSPRRRRIERDSNGRIIRLVDELEDAG